MTPNHKNVDLLIWVVWKTLQCTFLVNEEVNELIIIEKLCTPRYKVLGICRRQAWSMGLLGGCYSWEIDLGTLTIGSPSSKLSEFFLCCH